MTTSNELRRIATRIRQHTALMRAQLAELDRAAYALELEAERIEQDTHPIPFKVVGGMDYEEFPGRPD